MEEGKRDSCAGARGEGGVGQRHEQWDEQGQGLGRSKSRGG